jgi:hypothetical protein
MGNIIVNDDCLSVIMDFTETAMLFVNKFVCKRFNEKIKIILEDRKTFDIPWTFILSPSEFLKFKCIYCIYASKANTLSIHKDEYYWKHISSAKYNKNLTVLSSSHDNTNDILNYYQVNNNYLKTDYDSVTQYLNYYSKYVYREVTFCDSIIKLNNLELLKWFHDNNGIIYDITDTATKIGNIDILDWLQSKNKLSNEIYFWAILKNHDHVVKWAFNHNYNLDDDDIWYIIGYKGNINILLWFTEQNIKTINHKRIFDGAFYGGQLNMLKWLIENNWKTNGYVFYRCEYLIQSDNLEFIQYANNNSLVSMIDIGMYANFHGNTEIIKWLYEKGFYTNTEYVRQKWPNLL